MCGRFNGGLTIKQIAAFYQAVPDNGVEVSANYNVAPSQQALIVRDAKDQERHISLARFGTPMTLKGKTFALINLQSEKIGNREGFKHRRCIIPAAGFYEWEKISAKEKQPYYFSPTEGFFSFAGIWTASKYEISFSILTTQANEIVAPVHARMPVILTHNMIGEWLWPEADPAALTSLLQPYPDSQMQKWKVDKAVNSPRNNGVECINSI